MCSPAVAIILPPLGVFLAVVSACATKAALAMRNNDSTRPLANELTQRFALGPQGANKDLLINILLTVLGTIALIRRGSLLMLQHLEVVVRSVLIKLPCHAGYIPGYGLLQIAEARC